MLIDGSPILDPLTWPNDLAKSYEVNPAVPQPPLISVIIPCHDYGHFLDDALQSIRSQTWARWECIIMDDGSTDNTRQVAELHRREDPRIYYIYQDRQGVSAARNAAIAASTGRYLQFLDADDKIEGNKLASQVEFLEGHPDVDLVYGDVSYFLGTGCKPKVAVAQRMRFPVLSGSGHHLLDGLVRRNIMVINAPLLRRSAIDAVGHFDPQLRGHEDWDLWIRLAMGGKVFHFLTASGSNALVRVHANSTVQNVVPMLHSHLQVRRRLQRSLPTPRLIKINNCSMALSYARLAKIEFRNRRMQHAWRYARNALIYSKGDLRILAFLCMPEKFAAWLIGLTYGIRRPGTGFPSDKL
jgi:glycosyltransferase involved in cell wall biosynthesis